MHTPDTNAPTPLEPASIAKRFAAFCYDLLLLAGIVFCFTLLVILIRGGREISPGTAWFELALLGIALLFFCGFWTHGGQTLGMRAWRIRVVRENGAPLRWPRAALRFVAALLSLLPLGLGLWWGVLDRQRRGWHDRLAGTRVVRLRPPAAASAPAPPPRS